MTLELLEQIEDCRKNHRFAVDVPQGSSVVRRQFRFTNADSYQLWYAHILASLERPRAPRSSAAALVEPQHQSLPDAAGFRPDHQDLTTPEEQEASLTHGEEEEEFKQDPALGATDVVLLEEKEDLSPSLYDVSAIESLEPDVTIQAEKESRRRRKKGSKSKRRRKKKRSGKDPKLEHLQTYNLTLPKPLGLVVTPFDHREIGARVSLIEDDGNAARWNQQHPETPVAPGHCVVGVHTGARFEDVSQLPFSEILRIISRRTGDVRLQMAIIPNS